MKFVMDILSLPSEILPTVFGFLSLEDRKNVRLTCEAFRDACDQANIVKRERFFFHFGYFGNYTDTSTFVKYIENCKRIRPRTEFRAVNLTRLSLRLWENLGNRITSLLLHHCRLNDEVLARIFSDCSELVDLHVNVPDKVVLFAAEPNCLDRLIGLGIERVKLRTFKLFTQRSLSDNTFCKIFKIFPHIKTFGRGQYRQSGPKIPYQFLDDEQPASSPVPLPPSVENFIYHTNADSAWMVPYINQPTLNRFRELEFMLLILTDEDMTNAFDFFSGQTELEKIDLTILIFSLEGSPSILKTLLLQIAAKSTKLTAMRFHSNCEIEFSESEFTEFVATVPKNLKSLDISPLECAFELSSTPNLPSVDYRKLTHLRLDFESGWQLQSEIIKRCPSLRCLVVVKVNNDIVECILGDQHTELRKLTLDCTRHHDDCFLEGNLSPFPLQNLERLYVRNLPLPKREYRLHRQYVSTFLSSPVHVRERRYRSHAAATFVAKLDCPKLKVFRCYGTLNPDRSPSPGVSERDAIEMLNTLSQKAPLLETLILKSQLLVNQYHSHCANFKKLRYIAMSKSCDDIVSLTDDEVQQLFEACPSLYIVVNDAAPAQAHFYNRTTQSVTTYTFGKSFKKLCDVMDIQLFI